MSEDRHAGASERSLQAEHRATVSWLEGWRRGRRWSLSLRDIAPSEQPGYGAADGGSRGSPGHHVGHVVLVGGHTGSSRSQPTDRCPDPRRRLVAADGRQAEGTLTGGSAKEKPSASDRVAPLATLELRWVLRPAKPLAKCRSRTTMRSLPEMLKALRLELDQLDKVTVIWSTSSVSVFAREKDLAKPVWFAGSPGVIMTVSETEARLLLHHGARTPNEG